MRVSKRKREKRERGLKQTKGGMDAFCTGKQCERDSAGCTHRTHYLHLMRGASLYTFEPVPTKVMSYGSGGKVSKE